MPALIQISESGPGDGVLFATHLQNEPMKLAWVVESIDLDVASFRYRCLLPAWALSQFGYESSIFCRTVPDPSGFDALIAVKNAGTSMFAAAQRFRAEDKPVYIDLCDNVFVPGYFSKMNPDLTAERVCKLARHATGVVVPTRALARILGAAMRAPVSIDVIPDGAVTPKTHATIAKWMDQAIREAPGAVVPPRQQLTIKSIARKIVPTAWHHWTGLNGVNHHPAAEPRTSAPIQLPADTAKIVWFGKHGTTYGQAGMMLLAPLLSVLESVHKTRPVELVVISNSRKKFNRLCDGVNFYTRYERWNNQLVFEELARSDVFVMPTARDPFSMCKSANRAVLSLANNVPVVASYLEDLETLREAIIVDDWKAGLEQYLFDPQARATDLAKSARIIEQHYSATAIAQKWNAILQHQAASPQIMVAQ